MRGAMPMRFFGFHLPVLRILSGFIMPFILSSILTAEEQVTFNPELRIKSPFAGPIWRADIDRDGKFAVVSNNYHSLNIWTLFNSAQPTIRRVPIKDEERKPASAVA